MPKSLCFKCILIGYCRLIKVNLVSDQQLGNPEYIRDLRAFCRKLNVGPTEWREFLTSLYRDFLGWIVGPDGSEVFLDMEEFERPYIDDYFEYFCCTAVPPHVTPYVLTQSRERVRILATILTAHYPNAAQCWGMRGVNDNRTIT